MRNWLTLGGLALVATCALAQNNLRYFYDDANELFRVLDTTGTLIEYVYDASGNITKVNRTTVPPNALSILNVVPLNGAAGQTATIYGQNFSATAAGDTVQFGGVTATVLSASTTALVVQIPAGFATGLVTVMVNGVTVDSGSLTFTPPPTITSIAPTFGNIGQTLTAVVVQGLNLNGATFDLSGGGTVTPTNVTNTQATLNITLGQTPGPYVLIATAGSGPSSSAPTDGNTFIVYNTPGKNYSDMPFSVFNTGGITPNYPPGTNVADMRFSVFNVGGSTPNFPAGSNRLDLPFSVFNYSGPTPNYPAGTNRSDLAFSVFNSTGPTPRFPAGSNQAYQLYSTKNLTGTPPGLMSISMSRTGGRINLADTPLRDSAPEREGRQPVIMIAGQSVELRIQPAAFTQYLEVDADGKAIATSTTGSITMPLTAPFGVSSFTLTAAGYSHFGSSADSITQPVHVIADRGRIVAGRVVDANGAPVEGAQVSWRAQGLAAEYFPFAAELRAIPDLTSAAPARSAFLGALNYPNPQQVFGVDPMGVGLGVNYAARLSGRIEAETAGIYQFSLRVHAGGRLKIDSRVVAEGVASGADATVATGSLYLTAGPHEIEVTHFESAGAAALQLLWTPPGGIASVVPPSRITADAPVIFRTVSGSDGRFLLRVPAALDGVAVKLQAGTGTIEADQ